MRKNKRDAAERAKVASLEEHRQKLSESDVQEEAGKENALEYAKVRMDKGKFDQGDIDAMFNSGQIDPREVDIWEKELAAGKLGGGNPPANGGAAKPSLLDDKAASHVLDGDATGGGHRSGTGFPGKSEFPRTWSDSKIQGEISDIATDPAAQISKPDVRGYVVTTGVRDGVEIKVIIDTRNGRIVTGYPVNLPRNLP